MTTSDTASLNSSQPPRAIYDRGFDLLIFRPDETGKIISAFPYSRTEDIGKSIYTTEMSSGVSEYVADMLTGFSRVPFLVNTRSGPAIIIRSMVASADICTAVILHMSINEVSGLVSTGAFEMLILPPGFITDNTKATAVDAYATKQLRYIYSLICGGFYGIGTTVKSGYQDDKRFCGICDRLIAIAQCLAEVVGCKVVFKPGFYLSAEAFDKLNSDLYAAVILLLLAVCARYGLRRCAEIRLFPADDGMPLIRCSIDLLDRYYGSPEIQECRRIVDRYNTPFDITGRGTGKIKISFCPVHYEWSALGVKNKAELSDNNT